jgi:hypothetical protein
MMALYVDRLSDIPAARDGINPEPPTAAVHVGREIVSGCVPPTTIAPEPRILFVVVGSALDNKYVRQSWRGVPVCPLHCSVALPQRAAAQEHPCRTEIGAPSRQWANLIGFNGPVALAPGKGPRPFASLVFAVLCDPAERQSHRSQHKERERVFLFPLLADVIYFTRALLVACYSSSR